MNSTKRLQKLFVDGFRALDIAEPLPSFDADRDAASVRRGMEALGTPVAGLRTSGQVRGWTVVDDLDRGRAIDHLRPFAEGQVLPEEAGLPAALEALDRHPYCFLSTLGTVDALVTRHDVDKPAARMWLFGNITIIEMVMNWTIEQRYPTSEWLAAISDSRRRKAEALMAERRRRGQRVSIVDCLQLSDKGTILFKDPEVIADAGFSSRREAKELLKRLESLRNSLSHAQAILPEDWPAIRRLATRLERLMGRLTADSELVARARRFAIDAHDRIDHRRKYTHEPYWVHLEAVASTVGEITRDPEMLAAAWLHDTVEDTAATIEQVRELFGERVACLVDDLTDISRPSDGNRAKRTAINQEHSAQADPRAMTIKLADVIDNVRSISEEDPRFGRIYVAEKEALLEVLEQGDARLLKRARAVLQRAHEIVDEVPGAN